MTVTFPSEKYFNFPQGVSLISPSKKEKQQQHLILWEWLGVGDPNIPRKSDTKSIFTGFYAQEATTKYRTLLNRTTQEKMQIFKESPLFQASNITLQFNKQ